MHDHHADPPQMHWSDGTTDPHVAFAPEIRHYPETSTPPEVQHLADGGFLLVLDTGEGQEVGVHLGDVATWLAEHDAKLPEVRAVLNEVLVLLGDMPCCLDELLGPDLWARVKALG